MEYKQIYSAIIVFFICVSTIAVSAQEKVLKNDPYSTSLILQLKLVDFECGVSDILRYSVGLRGDYFFPKVASVNASWHQTVFSTIIASDADIYENENSSLSQFQMLEVGGRLHLSDKEGVITVKSYEGSQGAFSFWSIMDGVPVRKIFAIRGGAFSTSVPVSSGWSTYDNGIGEGNIVTRDGTIIGGYPQLFTQMRTSGLYGGLSWSQFANAEYTSRGKTRVSKFFKEVYFDVLYAPSVEFDPFVVSDAVTGKQIEYEVEPDMEGSFRTSNIGWRAGVYRVKSKKKLNVMFGLEVGARPGIFFKGGYFSSSVALSFST